MRCVLQCKIVHAGHTEPASRARRADVCGQLHARCTALRPLPNDYKDARISALMHSGQVKNGFSPLPGRSFQVPEFKRVFKFDFLSKERSFV
jgi:hypothetical protein